MKKLSVIAMCVCLMGMMAGCGSQETAKVIEGDVANKTETSAEAETSEGEAAETEVKSAAEEKGYVFKYKDAVVVIDAEAAPIVEALGEADSYFEAPSCAFEGIDKTYTYADFQVGTYPLEDVDYISEVTFKNDAVSTVEGISVGDSKDKVVEAYGEPASDESGAMEYEKDGMRLTFVIKDDCVASVEYRSTVLDE